MADKFGNPDADTVADTPAEEAAETPDVQAAEDAVTAANAALAQAQSNLSAAQAAAAASPPPPVAPILPDSLVINGITYVKA